jgi:hypothetical protein
MVKPNRWLVTAGIFALFAVGIHKLITDLNDAFDIY